MAWALKKALLVKQIHGNHIKQASSFWLRQSSQTLFSSNFRTFEGFSPIKLSAPAPRDLEANAASINSNNDMNNDNNDNDNDDNNDTNNDNYDDDDDNNNNIDTHL